MAPKLAGRGIEDKLIKHKIGGLLFYMHPWNDFRGDEQEGQFTMAHEIAFGEV